MKRLQLYMPLIGFVGISCLIGYLFVIPGTCVEGWNELNFGFVATLAGAALTYEMGLRLAARNPKPSDG